jgi:hypothetical protein
MDKTKELLDYLDTWLQRHQQASEVAPAIREARDRVDWEVRVLRDLPAEAAHISTAQVNEEARVALGRITEVLPQLPPFRATLRSQIDSIATTSTSAAFGLVHEVGQIVTVATTRFFQEKSREYERLQETQKRRDRVRALTQALVPLALGRFDDARVAVDRAQLGAVTKSGAASDLRNLVNGVKGELLHKARRSSNEKMAWRTMAERLCDGQTAISAMMSQEVIQSTLLNDLAATIKLRDDRHRIEDLYTRVLDHLFAVLSNVNVASEIR